jgi:cysteine desulfuration protein SufE
MSTSSASLPPALEKIVRRLQQTTEPKRRYEYLLWLAKRLPELPESEKTAENKVPGCVSQVFITAELVDGKVAFQADSDAQLTKGLVALLVEGLKGLTPQEISQLTPDFIKETGLDVSLTPSRANGFYNIFQAMQRKALLCQLEMAVQSVASPGDSSEQTL